MSPVTDPLEGAGLGDLGAALRAEWRADEEEWTRAAVERWRHERTLLDVLREHMHRGDTVALRLPHVTLTGMVSAVGEDLFAVASGDARVDVQIGERTPLVVRVVERARAGGTRGNAVTTFRARLLELETGGQEVDVATTAGDVLHGRLGVGSDHVIVDDHVIMQPAIAWIRVPRW